MNGHQDFKLRKSGFNLTVPHQLYARAIGRYGWASGRGKRVNVCVLSQRIVKEPNAEPSGSLVEVERDNRNRFESRRRKRQE